MAHFYEVRIARYFLLHTHKMTLILSYLIIQSTWPIKYFCICCV